jgi:hypothetical protein
MSTSVLPIALLQAYSIKNRQGEETWLRVSTCYYRSSKATFALLRTCSPRLGSKMKWRDQLNNPPSYVTDIDNSRSMVLEKLANLITTAKELSIAEVKARKARELQSYIKDGLCATRHCAGDETNI